MIPIEPLVDGLRGEGVRFYTGVPCSLLAPLVSHVDGTSALRYIAASGEGEAMGIATGAYLAGELPVVAIQNSGLGNCVNPIVSLALPYGIPCLLMVSHRGEHGRDAPQHLVMGAVQEELLRAIRIPMHRLPDRLDAATLVMKEALASARSAQQPVAVIVSRGTLETRPAPRVRRAGEDRRWTGPRDAPRIAALPSRLDALARIHAALDPADVVVATTGMCSRELFSLGDREASFYMMGSMGCASAIGLGIALCRPSRKVVVIDGDGAFLMRLGSVATIGHQAPPGLLHLVLDNASYETTGGQPTASPSISFEGIAAAAGYRSAHRLGSLDALESLVSAFRPGSGPAFATLEIAGGRAPGIPRVKLPPSALRDRMLRALCG